LIIFDEFAVDQLVPGIRLDGLTIDDESFPRGDVIIGSVFLCDHQHGADAATDPASVATANAQAVMPDRYGPARYCNGPIATRNGGFIAARNGGPIAARNGGPIAARNGGPIAARNGGFIAARNGGPIAACNGGPIAARNGGPIAARNGGPIAACNGGPIAARNGGPIAARNGGPIAARLALFRVISRVLQLRLVQLLQADLPDDGDTPCSDLAVIIAPAQTVLIDIDLAIAGQHRGVIRKDVRRAEAGVKTVVTNLRVLALIRFADLVPVPHACEVLVKSFVRFHVALLLHVFPFFEQRHQVEKPAWVFAGLLPDAL